LDFDVSFAVNEAWLVWVSCSWIYDESAMQEDSRPHSQGTEAAVATPSVADVIFTRHTSSYRRTFSSL
jgi:hypothetical protein